MRVPVYERQAGIAALPAVQSPVLMPENDGGNAIAGAVRNLADRAIKIHNDLEDAQTLELFSKFKADSSDFHDNPDTGIFNTRTGYLSQGLFQDADNWMRKRGEVYARQLHSPRAKNNFRRMASDFITQQGHTNSRFEAAQMKKYRSDTADAAVKNYLADIEAHWDDTDYIKRAREAINQALELKHRGEGREVFFNAGLEVDDQIAQARIRQAYLRDPLRAVQLLNDRDIKLKPDTRAKLTEALRNKTEIYELRAIAEEYAKNFTPENSADAERKLIQTYGAEKGQKAFQALAHIWSVQNYQDTAQRRNTALQQAQAEDDFVMRFMSNDDTLTAEEIQNAARNKIIDPNKAMALIRGLHSRENEAQKLIKEQQKLQAKKAQIELEFLSWAGNWADDNFLQGFVRNGAMTDDEARAYRNRREQFYADKRKSTLSDTADNLTRKLVDPDKFGRLTLDEIQANIDNLDPDKANALKNAVEARNKAEQAQAAKNDEEARKHFQTSLRIIAENGGIIPHEQVNELLDKRLIDDSFAMYLYGKEDSYNTEQERSRKQAEKQQAEQDKLQRKEKIYAQAQQFARVYPTGHSGEGRSFIQGLNIPVDDKNQLLQYYDDIIQSQRQRGKDTSDEARRSREEIHNFELANIINGRGQSREFYQKALDEGNITPKEYNDYIAELDKREKAAAKVQEDSLKDTALRNADSIFQQFGLDNLDAAYEAIRAIPDRNERRQTWIYFEDRLTQERTVRQEDNRINSERQKQNFRDIDNNYWRNFKTVPPHVLDDLRDNEGLTEEQYQRAQAVNAKIGQRSGVIDEIIRSNPDFNNWTLASQEAEIMSRMGTTEDDRKQNVANLLALLQDGKLTDAQIDFDFYHGKISTEDRENIKNFDKRFEKMQKSAIHATEANLLQFIHNLGVIKPELRQELIRNASVDFMLATNKLDVRDKDFYARLQYIHDTLVQNISTVYAEKVSLDGWLSRRPAGIRYDAARARADMFSVPKPQVSMPFQNSSGAWSYIDTQGNQFQPQTFTPTQTTQDNIQHDPYYQDIPQEFFTPFYPQPRQQNSDNGGEVKTVQNTTTNTQTRQPRDIGLEMLPGATVTGRFDDWRAYRNGKHNGGDYAMPEGSNITSADFGLPVSVAKIGSNPYKEGGNSVILEGYDDNGDHYEFIVSHMKNGSIPLKVGDLVAPGTVIGQVGNTGMTSDRAKGGITAWYKGKSSGYHMDLKIRINGKYIDPQKYIPPARNNVQNIPAPPVVSSENERLDALNAILFGNLGSLDIFTPSGSFGVNY